MAAFASHAARWARYRAPLLSGSRSQGVSAPSSLLTGLTGYWKLDEASGTRLDSTANDLDLTDNNTVTQAVGKVGSAGQFTAANSEYLSRADEAALRTGDIDFTFAAWVYLDTTVNQSLVSKYQSTGNQREHALVCEDAAWKWYVSANGTATTILIYAAAAPNTGAWHLLVAWHDAAANKIHLQVDNGTVEEAAHAGGVFAGTALFSLSAILDGTIYFTNGRIDEVGFWKRTLTVAERTALYNSGNGVTYPAFA